MRNAGPGGRFLRDHGDTRPIAISKLVRSAEEIDSLDILPAAVAVRKPFAFLARIVAIEHRGDRIDSQPVEVIALEPEERIVDEEVRHLATAEIVDGGVPVGMESEPRVFMLIERRAVKAGKAVLVSREVGGHP